MFWFFLLIPLMETFNYSIYIKNSESGWISFQWYVSKMYANYMGRSSHRRCSIKIVALKNFAKFTGKHLCQSLFFNKVAAPTLLKKRLWHRCFPVNLAKFLGTPFLQNTSERQLLYGVYLLIKLLSKGIILT